MCEHEQNLLSAGAPTEVLDHARAKGISFSDVFALYEKYKQFGPVAWQFIQDVIALFHKPAV